jgi:tetratricopeptide (TPR) repeat protein
MSEPRSGTVSPEIARLSEKLQKDPQSRSFLNLAEEYYKGGMSEEAQIVLQTGLKVHPNLVGAKLLLARIFSEQSKTEEARELFEQILKVNPDNIIVNKKLATIYFEKQLLNEAEKCCAQVLLFSSKDADALNLIHKIKEAKRKTEPSVPLTPPVPEAPPQAPEPETGPAAEGGGSEAPGDAVSVLPAPEVPPAEAQAEPFERPDTSERPEEEPVSADIRYDFSDIMKEEEVSSPAKPVPSASGTGRSNESFETLALAELYIKQGHYQKGIGIYQNILDQDPYNETVRQQLEDAKTIGNLLGIRDDSNQIERKILETIIPPEEAPAPVVSPPPAPVNSVNQLKIDRLKRWLDQIRKVQ